MLTVMVSSHHCDPVAFTTQGHCSVHYKSLGASDAEVRMQKGDFHIAHYHCCYCYCCKLFCQMGKMWKTLVTCYLALKHTSLLLPLQPGGFVHGFQIVSNWSGELLCLKGPSLEPFRHGRLAQPALVINLQEAHEEVLNLLKRLFTKKKSMCPQSFTSVTYMSVYMKQCRLLLCFSKLLRN